MPGPVRQRFVESVLVPLGLLAASVVAHLLVAWTQVRIAPRQTVVRALTRWDGDFYLQLARSGYPAHLKSGSAAAAQSTLGFYPLYSLLVRALVDVSPLSYRAAGLVVAIASAAAAVLVIWRLTAWLCDAQTATYAVAFVVFGPGAIVLSMSYSEPLFLLLAAGCLLTLLDEHWEIAGLLAFGACLTRPNGLAVVAACAVAAVVALRADRRQWRALVAPTLATVGFLALPVYQQIHTGDFLAYWKTQHRGWGQGFDFGVNTLHKFAGFLVHPFRDFNVFMSCVCVVVIVAGLFALARWRPPAPIVAYTLVVLALAVGSSQLVSTFRFAMTAFPLAIAFGRITRGTALVIALALAVVFFAIAAAAATSVLYTP